MTLAPLTVAVAQPPTRRDGLAANVAAHAEAVRAARARVVVFPELSLTGYELDATPVDLGDPRLDALRDACGEMGSIALVGAPVEEADGAFIAMLRVDGEGIQVVHRKVWLHGAEFDRFTAGNGASTTVIDGWTVGLAICRDTGISIHTEELAAHGVDLYVAGVLDVPGEQPPRSQKSATIARALDAPVAIASYAGPTTLYPSTTGGSAIHGPSGDALTKAGESAGEFVAVTLRSNA